MSEIEKLTGERPLLCLDEVGIYLDSKREEALYKQLDTLGASLYYFTPPTILSSF